ncbi:heterokaryon incompatibility protein-domain-containing protein [Truncatella angustata]|uniref:Heterokaryon incompatibility protein-domain-containing protein n=1 Tax=Truncatella angustata TaxID=152316 RepID=A0A9P8RJ34_9PEZI|nr:heterokaryon incompatibility protein-domain-containing protein [Truncatella angustata]KAH6638547.1 heterokaryon incompatibility protein-domain-containing protein [Truncatella angustata]
MTDNVYEYESINLDELTFRIVRLLAGTGSDIEVDIIHATLDDEERIPYEALSYAWGSELKPNVVLVNGAQLAVTHNLWYTMRDLRYADEDRYLWIDAICINQSSNDERNHQVKQMGDIYNKATSVLFHLGRSSDNTHVLMTSLIELQRKSLSVFWRPQDQRWEEAWLETQSALAESYFDFHTRLRQGLDDLLARVWFRRVWVLQEVANARSAVVYCGADSIPSRFFLASPRLLGVQVDSHVQAVLDMMPIKRRESSPWGSGQDLYDLLQRFGNAEASDERDNIFALLGMCAGGKGHGSFTADYSKDIKETIREAVAPRVPHISTVIIKSGYSTRAIAEK